MTDFDTPIDRSGTHTLKFDGCISKFSTDDLLPLWVADMDFAAPECVQKAIQTRACHPVYGYTLTPKSWFEAIIHWFDTRHHWHLKHDWILPLPGVVPAISLAIQTYTQPGDSVLIQSPVYHPFYSCIERNGRKCVTNELVLTDNHYEIDFDRLDQQLSSGVKMLILCSPHNPVSRVWTRDELTRVAELCLRHHVLVVSDEIHADFVFPGFKHLPFAALSPAIAQQTITLNSANKTFNIAGLESAYAIIENPVLKRDLIAAKDRGHLSAGNLFGIAAGEAAYWGGADWVDELMRYIIQNVDLVDMFLKQQLPKIKLIQPEGTYLLWLDCRELGMSDKDLKQFLIKTAKVGFNDGPMFGPGGTGFQRMNVATSRSVVLEALERIKRGLG